MVDRDLPTVRRSPPGLALGRPAIWGWDVDRTVDVVDTTFALPAGTVTFLLSDIEASTRLWEAEPDAMAEAVPLLYELIAEAVGRHGGVRPVEQGEGDSVVAAFSRASDAVAAALEAQRAVFGRSWPAGIELRVRIALHTAEAQLRDEGNYFGAALSRCARLRGIAQGGQTLISRAVHDLGVDRLPDGATLVDLGTHRLRDLGRPEHVYGLSHPDLPGAVQPLRSLDALPNNLPDQLTTFVGRVRELEEVTGLLVSGRLVTLTGAGGCGKTRLAAQAAAETLERFPDGTWWVELAPLTNPDGVDQGLAESLAVRPLPGQSSLDAAIARLAGARALIVLDNCEHLLPACAAMTEAVLRACPEVTVLATSRAPLGVPGETTWRVPSLSLPRETRIEPLDALNQSDAVRLFIERALQVRPNFTVNADNAPALAQLCHDLDGIPLAIELAAARVRVLTPQEIASGLGDRFRLLTGGARSAMPRQQTLRASVDWSHDLLSDDERTLFRRLAVFAGGWTLDAVEEVCTGDGIDRLAILDLLTSLVDKSMVAAEERGDGMRYRLLETVRQYALDRLSLAGELEIVRDRHRDAFLALAERVAPHLYQHAPAVWLEALDLEAANLALAADRAAETDGERALRLCSTLTVWWKFRGRFELADATYLQALDAPGAESSRLRAGALWARAYLLVYGGRFDEALVIAGEALELAEALGDGASTARALTAIGTVLMLTDPLAARSKLERARELARDAGDDWSLAESTEILATTFIFQASVEAPALLAEAYEIYERSGYAEFAAWYWWGVAVVSQAQGRDHEALASFDRAIEAADAVGELVSSGTAHGFRALLRAERGEGSLAAAELPPVVERAIAAGAGLAMPALLAGTFYAQASIGQLEQARDSLAWYIEANIGGGPYGNTSALMGIARIELLLDQPDKAAEHARLAADINDRQLRNPLIAATARQRLAAAALLGGEPRNAERLAHEALAVAVEHGFGPVIFPVLDVLAGVAVALESFEEGARILGAAERAREEVGHVRWAREQQKIDLLHQSVHNQLGDDATTAFDAGRAMSTDEAVSWLRRARGSRKRPAGGWESLTPTELQVVNLAGQGLTNPEIAARMFVARGTVKVHLSHVYTKLDVRNRSELAALAANRTTPTSQT
jgi:predicted ATPase/class 3 adenylate cyclase/DNA-binding CsgD family transcriptional regulator